VSPLAIHTDACKGLENAVKNVFPHAKQRECFDHMWMNVIRKFKGDEYGRLWPVARSYTKPTHSYHVGKIMAADITFSPWMNQYHSLLWYRSGFNTAIKCDHINNNLAESFNNRVKELKYLHVHDMVDQIRIMIMRLWELRRRLANVLQRDKLSNVVEQVVNRSRNLAHLCVEKSSLWGAEVRDTKTGKGML
jgi:transposase-like protein